MTYDREDNMMKKLLQFETDEQKLQFEAEMIHLDIVFQIIRKMEEKDMNKSELAQKLKTSKGYITQLFTGDKLLNIKTLAKLQRMFNAKFKIDFVEKRKALDEQLFRVIKEHSSHLDEYLRDYKKSHLSYDNSDIKDFEFIAG